MKKQFIAFLLIIIIHNAAFAQTVTVDGVGHDKDAALKDAMRNAVESIVGIFIDSRTLVDKSIVALDDIYAKSQGFVKNIKILNEMQKGDFYRITAQIDVDAEPNARLIDELSMIMALNDPRITVIIDDYNDRNERNNQYSTICESYMNNKLIKLGFNHVLDAEKIKAYPDNKNFNNIDTDYIVLGILDIHTKDITLPNYRRMTSGEEVSEVNTGLLKSLATLEVKVMKADTQEIIGQFRVEESILQSDKKVAETKAVEKLGINAAESLRKIFALKASNIDNYVNVIIKTDSNDDFLKIEQTIRKISGVHNVQIRSFSAGKGFIEVETVLKPVQLYKALREHMNVFLESSSENVLEISI